MDGMTGIIYRDDSLVVELVARKFYDLTPRAEVTVIKLQKTPFIQ